jgi:hypothetical protein
MGIFFFGNRLKTKRTKRFLISEIRKKRFSIFPENEFPGGVQGFLARRAAIGGCKGTLHSFFRTNIILKSIALFGLYNRLPVRKSDNFTINSDIKIETEKIVTT